jgi:hypothetical protein
MQMVPVEKLYSFGQCWRSRHPCSESLTYGELEELTNSPSNFPIRLRQRFAHLKRCHGRGCALRLTDRTFCQRACYAESVR